MDALALLGFGLLLSALCKSMGSENSTARPPEPQAQNKRTNAPWNEQPEPTAETKHPEAGLWSQDDLINKLKEIKPRQNMKFVDVLLIGPVGCGKSSFINTAVTALTKQVSAPLQPAIVRSLSSHSSVTMSLQPYKLPKTQIVLWDLFGFDPDKDYSSEVKDGNSSRSADNSYGAEYTELLVRDLAMGNVAPKTAYKTSIGCLKTSEGVEFDAVVFLIGCESKFDYSTMLWQTFKQFDSKFRNLAGFSPSVFLTKADCVLKDDGIATEDIFHSKSMQKVIERVCVLTGIPAMNIAPVISYHSCQHAVRKFGTPVEVLCLRALLQLLERATSYQFDPENSPEA